MPGAPGSSYMHARPVSSWTPSRPLDDRGARHAQWLYRKQRHQDDAISDAERNAGDQPQRLRIRVGHALTERFAVANAAWHRS